MLTHPGFDPVAIHFPEFEVFGRHFAPAIHWYGLMYLIGFVGAWWLGTLRARQPHIQWPRDRVSDLLFYVVMGVILGGRIGYTLFYNFSGFLQEPLVIVRMWEGGMSFHGGLLGVVIAFFAFAHKHRLNVFDIADFTAPLVPVGLFTGRIGNFINAELWGAPTSLPWGMVFPRAGAEPRHPTMLYEAFLEGIVLCAILWWFGRKPRPRMALSGLFLVLYALFRTGVEFLRLPDAHIGYLYGTDWMTMGMMLCVPMWLVGGVMLYLGYRKGQPRSCPAR